MNYLPGDLRHFWGHISQFYLDRETPPVPQCKTIESCIFDFHGVSFR
jgi:hypothetical protein